VDTPGFDDTYRSDTDILHEISYWLADNYSKSRKLAGIIYLHDMKHDRMTRSAMVNLAMFQNLCGEDCLSNVVLTTTKWSTQAEELIRQKEHEVELTTSDSFWGLLVRKGVRVRQYDRTYDCALSIIEMLETKKSVVLDIQHQLIDEGKTLAETSAGRKLEEDINRERERHQKELQAVTDSVEAALRNKDYEMEEILRKHKAEMQERIAKSDEDRIRGEEAFNQKIEEMRHRHENDAAAQRAREEAHARERQSYENSLRNKEEAVKHGEAQINEIKTNALSLVFITIAISLSLIIFILVSAHYRVKAMVEVVQVVETILKNLPVHTVPVKSPLVQITAGVGDVVVGGVKLGVEVADRTTRFLGDTVGRIFN
jgi:hypothetical protein